MYIQIVNLVEEDSHISRKISRETDLKFLSVVRLSAKIAFSELNIEIFMFHFHN